VAGLLESSSEQRCIGHCVERIAQLDQADPAGWLLGGGD
jgi:hypothetical protein